MTQAVQLRKGTTSEHSTFTGLQAEATVDTTKKTIVVHDGSTAGGIPLSREDLSNANPSNLTTIVGADTASGDLFVVYDVSASAFKKITRAELNNAMEQDALASVAITGGSINGTTIGASTASTGAFTTLSASSTVTLSGGTANGVLYLDGSKVATSGSALTFDGNTLTATNTSGNAIIASRGGKDLRLSGNYAGANTHAVISTTTGMALAFMDESSEFMRLTSTSLYTASGINVGIGTSSPGAKLDVVSAGNVFRFANSSGNAIDGGADGSGFYIEQSGGSGASQALRLQSANASSEFARIDLIGSSNVITFRTKSIERLQIDALGNLGLGVTPSAWRSTNPAFQIGQTASVFAYSASNIVGLGNNVFINSAGDEKYIATATAGLYRINGNAHEFFNAASGTAGNTITFTQAMTLDASGNLVVGGTSAAYKIHSYGFVGSESTVDAGFVNKLSGNQALYLHSNANESDITELRNLPLLFKTNSTERARITSGGDLQISSGGSFQVGGTAARATTAGTNRIDIFNGTAPVGTLTNGISLYSSSGEAYVMDAAGNATLFSPHDAETNEWVFKSKHTPTGKVLKIDVEKLLRFINDHFGLDAVHEFIES